MGWGRPCPGGDPRGGGIEWTVGHGVDLLGAHDLVSMRYDMIYVL
jgi:hypothetical protein